MVECQSCSRIFDNVHGMRIHHVQAHGESIAGETITCEWCNEEFVVQRDKVDERKFCSRECTDEWRSENICGENHPNYHRIDVDCDNCGKRITRPPSVVAETERNFCSQNCKYKSLGELFSERRRGEDNPMFGMTGEDHHRWKGGYELTYGPEWPEKRQEALERDDHECQDCGMDREEHQAVFNYDLEVHHIQPFKTFDDTEEAHQLTNLITLCTNCHMNREQS